MKKKEIIDAKTRKALDTIGYGDDVQFVDCFEAQVYGEKTFKVMSEEPQIIRNRYGTFVTVRLQHLGWFPIDKLKLVRSNIPSDEEKAKNGLCCCLHGNCSECDYRNYGFACIDYLHKDLSLYAEKIENFRSRKEAKNV